MKRLQTHSVPHSVRNASHFVLLKGELRFLRSYSVRVIVTLGRSNQIAPGGSQAIVEMICGYQNDCAAKGIIITELPSPPSTEGVD